MDKGFFTYCFRKGYERSKAFKSVFEKPEVRKSMGMEELQDFNIRLITVFLLRKDDAEKHITFKVNKGGELEQILGPYDGKDYFVKFPEPITDENYAWYADYVYTPVSQIIDKLEYEVKGIDILGDEELTTEKEYELENARPGDDEPVWFPFLVDEEDRIVSIEKDRKTTREEAQKRAEELLKKHLLENPDKKYGCGITYTDITENGKYMLI